MFTCRYGGTKICSKLGAGIQRYGRRSKQGGSTPSVEYEIPATNTLRPPTGKSLGPIDYFGGHIYMQSRIVFEYEQGITSGG